MTLLADHYVLWSWLLFFMLLSTGLYLYRQRWLAFVKNILPKDVYQRLRSSTFAEDAEAGLSSDSFSLAANIADGDIRGGLDLASKQEVLKIMKKKKVDFDEARHVFLQQKLARNGIGIDGRPLGIVPHSETHT